MSENVRFPVKLFPSATATDVLFYTLNGPKLDKRKIPAYGTAYNAITPKVEDWPDHKLVYVSPPDGDGMQKWFFAADRANQDVYNFERKRVEIAGVEYEAVTRTYLIPRASFTPATPAIGTAMPNVPADLFTGSFLLFDKDQGKADMQELDSLYVIERRIYVKFTGGQEKVRGQGSLKPAKFKRLVIEKKTRTLHPLEGETIPDGDLLPTPPTLTGDQKEIVFAKRNDEQFYKIITEEVLSGADALVGQQFAPDGVLLATSESLVTEGTNAEKGVNIAQSVVSPLGDGTSVSDTSSAKKRNTSDETVDGWPLKQKKVKGVDDLTPAKFKRLTTKTTTAEQVDLAASAVDDIPEPDTPAGNQTVIDHTKVNDYRYEKSITTEDIDTDADPLVGYKLTSDGQVATVTERLIVTGGVDDTISGSATTVDANTDPLGNGQSVKTVSSVDSLLPKYQYQASNNPLIAPDKFRINPGEKTVTHTTTGNATQPTLTGNYSAKSEQQIDAFTKRVSESEVLSNTTGIVKGTSVDPRTGEVFEDNQELVPAASVTASGEVDASGNVVLYDGYNANWSVKTTRRVASNTSKTWDEIVNYEWPPVLLGVEYKIWEAKSGESVIYPVVKFREGFQGPQKATVTQYWSKVAPAVIPPISMIPEGFTYQCPLFTLRVPPCLHATQTINVNIGSSDPDWESATDSETYPATNYTDWPASVMWRESRPDRGGFLVTEYVINKPS